MAGPLAGIRVLEVEGLGPGPFAAMMLADLGAEVLVVHRPAELAPPGVRPQPVTDRGKRSIVLDLKADEGRQTFLRLAARADALIEGFRPGVMERLGLGPEPLMAANPRLVYGRMTGWGQEGPLAARAGHDLNYLSMAGALWLAAPPGMRPSVPPTMLGDIGGGALYLVAGILAGLLSAGRTGQGTVVDAAICDGAAHMMNLLLSLAGDVARAPETSPLVAAHWSRSYACADGRHISVQPVEPKFHALLLERLGLAGDPAFAAGQMDPAAWPALGDRLAAIFAEKPQAHWEALFEGTDACVAPVLSPVEAAAHPHNRARRTWREGSRGLQAAAAPRFSTHPQPDPAPAPERGADGAAILRELAEGRGWGRG